jgi:hypothetical protein
MFEPAARFVLLIGLGLLGGSVGELLLRDREVSDPGEPRWKGDMVEALVVELPPIFDFDYYYGREGDQWKDLNPFVPIEVREIEKRQLENKEKPPRQTGSGQGNVVVIEEPPPVEITITIPDFEPPLLADTQKVQVPEVLGRVGMNGATYLLVRYEGKTWRLTFGEQVDRWTLKGIEQGEAVFLDDFGEQWRVRIGRSDEPVVNRLGSSSQPPAPPRPVAPPANGAAAPHDLSQPDADTLIQQLMAARNDPDALRALLSDPQARATLEADPRVRELMKSPLFQAMLQQQQQ